LLSSGEIARKVAGGYSQNLLEVPREVTLVSEAAFGGDPRGRHSLAQQPLRFGYA
jgi:hypothetical protein